MSERVTMPALGESVTEGTVTRWLKNVGDTVEVDEPLLEVSTDKVDTEIPSPVAGTLQEILVREDDTVPVGADLAVIGDGAGGGSEQPSSSDSLDAGAGAGSRHEPSAAQERAARAGPASRPRPPQEQPPAAGTSEQLLGRDHRDDARARRVGHRGHRHPLAEGRGRRGRGRRAAARGLHRQGRHRDPLAGRRHAQKILVQEDETVPVGADLAVVGGSGGGSAPAASRRSQEQAPQQAADEPRPRTASRPAEPPGRGRRARAGSRAGPAAGEAARPGTRHAGHRRPQQAPPRHEPSTRHRSPHRRPAGAAASGSDGGGAATPRPTSPRWCASWRREHGVDLGSVNGHRYRRPHPQAGRPRRRRGSRARPPSAPAPRRPGVHAGSGRRRRRRHPGVVPPSAAPPRR